MKPLVTMLAVLGLGLSAVADVVHLKNGSSLEGQVVRTDDGVIVKLPVGEVRISNNAIDRIEEKTSALETYQKRAAAIKEDDPEAHYKLGLWAQSVGLKPQAREEFGKAIALKPDHAEAHQALGHRLVGGQWMTKEQEMQARGLVKHEGQWMTPDASARLQALKAELELAREKRKAAEAELQKTQEQLKGEAQAKTVPDYGPNPYDQYYYYRPSTQYFPIPRIYYYWTPSYRPSYYIGLHGYWRPYPGGIRHVSPHRRHR